MVRPRPRTVESGLLDKESQSTGASLRVSPSLANVAFEEAHRCHLPVELLLTLPTCVLREFGLIGLSANCSSYLGRQILCCTSYTIDRGRSSSVVSSCLLRAARLSGDHSLACPALSIADSVGDPRASLQRQPGD